MACTVTAGFRASVSGRIGPWWPLVDDDCRGLARRLMGRLAEARATVGRAELDGRPVEIRRFLVSQASDFQPSTIKGRL